VVWVLLNNACGASRHKCTQSRCPKNVMLRTKPTATDIPGITIRPRATLARAPATAIGRTTEHARDASAAERPGVAWAGVTSWLRQLAAPPSHA